MSDDVSAPPGLVPLAKGREAEVFVRDDGDVVKVMFSASQEPRVQREAAALQALADREHLAPAFREITEVDGRPALVTERVAGEDFLTVLSKKPWLVLNVAGTLGRAHAAMHRHRAPDSLPELNHELGRRIESAKALPPNLAAEALRRLQTLPSDDRLCHGDFHPANILGTLAAPVIIDWGDASRGTPAADVARTLLLLRLGELPPNTPALMRALTAIGRGVLARRYLAVYRDQAPSDPLRLDDWMFVRAAARFNEEIEVEYPRLLQLLEQSPPMAAQLPGAEGSPVRILGPDR